MFLKIQSNIGEVLLQLSNSYQEKINLLMQLLKLGVEVKLLKLRLHYTKPTINRNVNEKSYLHLKDSFIFKEDKNSITIEVNPLKQKVLLWKEYGTRPHIIEPKNKKALTWLSNTNTGSLKPFKSMMTKNSSMESRVFAKKVYHPGTQGDYYISRVFMPEVEKLIDEIIKSINI